MTSLQSERVTAASQTAPNCEACGAPLRADRATAQKMGKPAEQLLWICGECGHRQVDPMPDAKTIASYYDYSEEDVKKHGITLDWTAGDGQLAPTYERRLQVVARRGRLGKLLDIGYGNGMFLKRAAQLGFQVTGIDPDQRFFEPDFPCELKQASLGRDVFPAGSFDVIAAHHVLEHVSDVEESLAAVHHLLKPGGVFLVELPHEVRSVVKRLQRLTGQRYSYISAYQHLRFFTPCSLRKLLEEHGFVVERCRSIPATECVRGVKSLAVLPLAPLEWLTQSGIYLEAIARRK